jgi:DNA helicase HerA-like ATPase
MSDEFTQEMEAGYKLNEPAIVFGSPLHDSQLNPGLRVQVALSMLNRHGLIAGATGTGKTKTLQLMAGQLSVGGVPCFVADIKGDLTGLAAPGQTGQPKIETRCQELGWEYQPRAHPVQFLSLSGKLGAQVRATVQSFGPVLLGKVLDLNETQTSILGLVFKYCDDNQLPLLDLSDLKAVLQYLSSDAGKPALQQYGGMSAASVGVLLRSIVTLQQQGADVFFGEPEFQVGDLLQTNAEGQGVLSVLELADVQDKPRLFSTFMLWLLAQLYSTLPEVGDASEPKLIFFFDEAHLLFGDASSALLEQVEMTARLIRSKGVGVFFVTQTPSDVPAAVLGQLGNRVQHALRAFTPQDQDAIKKTAKTFPVSNFYNTEQALTSLGTGEALVSVLSPNGTPTPLAVTYLGPPDSLMAAIPSEQLQSQVQASPLRQKYGAAVRNQGAREMLEAKTAAAQEQAQQAGQAEQTQKEQARTERERQQSERGKQRQRESWMRTGTRIASSRSTQTLIRSIFSTLFGGRR